MLGLFLTSLPVFVEPHWNSPWAFLFIYVPSGLAGFVGNSLLVQRMQQKTPPLSTWIFHGCKNAYDRYVLWRQAASKRLGASGAVYGVVGARIYTAIWSPYHKSLNTSDLMMLVYLIVEEMPRAIDMMRTTFITVDHTGHLFGFVTGMVTAWAWALGKHR
jgi:membrane associated rhomboid family serine protease